MKIYLDLLPEDKKEEIKKKRTLLKVIKNEVLFSVPIISFFLILVTVSVCLKIRSQVVDNNSVSENSQKNLKEIESYEASFKEINSKISYISKIQSSHLNWLGIFYKINSVVPENVYISDLATNDYQISLVGKAKTRDEFLKFEENIKEEDCFEGIDAPLSSLASKENVDFQINFNVKDDCLKTVSNSD